MTHLSVTLSDDLIEFIRAKVKSGHYATSSDVVVDALRRMETSEVGAELDGLRQAWQDGLVSGDFQPLNREAITDEGRKRLAART